MYNGIIDYIDSKTSTIKKTDTTTLKTNLKDHSESLQKLQDSIPNLKNNNSTIKNNLPSQQITPDSIVLKKKKKEVVWL